MFCEHKLQTFQDQLNAFSRTLKVKLIKYQSNSILNCNHDMIRYIVFKSEI